MRLPTTDSRHIEAISRRQFAKALAVAACALALPFPLAGCSGTAGQAGLGQGNPRGDGPRRNSGGQGGSQEEASPDLDWQEVSWELFDTVVEVRALTTTQVMDQMYRRCRFFHNAFSRTTEGGDIWRVNRAGTEPVSVEPETAELLKLSLEAGKASGGLFDVTIGAVSCLWDFKAGVIPSSREVRRVLPYVGQGMVTVRKGQVVKAHPQVKLDLGGIAKGYIADDLAKLLAEAGCESALLNLGGNVLAVGTKPDGSPWRIGVQDPQGQGLLATVEARDESVVTAGLYERSFVRKGVRYGHILDPRTGYPVETDVTSASVLTNSSMTADWLSTTMFLLGCRKGLALLEELGVAGLLADCEGNLNQAPGERFEKEESS